MTHRTSARPLAAALFLVAGLATPTTEAQTLQIFDGSAPASSVQEFTGPPTLPCNPLGPVVGAFPTLAGWACPTVGPIVAGSLDGACAVNRLTDTTWASDGVNVTEYAPGGLVLSSFAAGVLPGTITGMSWDAPAGVLFVTDGFFVAGIAPPPPPGCVPPAVVLPPFPVFSVTGAQVAGLAWDPLTGTLFSVDALGWMHNFVPGGAAGPFAPVNLTTTAPVAPPLTGVTVDTAAEFLVGLPILSVLDAQGNVAAVDAFGFPPPPTLYQPFPIYNTGLATPAGIGFSAHAIVYGTGGDTSGLLPPSIGSVGQTLTPNPAFAVTLSGSVPGSTAILYATQSGPWCPPAVVLGLPVWINAGPGLLVVGTIGVGGGGNAVLPAPIPPGLGPGSTVNSQWLVLTPFSLQVSDALHMTIALPL